MLIYVPFLLHADLYNDYADEDIPDSVGDLPYADIPDTVPAEEQAASPSPTAGSGSECRSPSQSMSPSPSRRSPPPLNVTQIMRLAGGLGLAAAISSADVVTDSFGTNWKVPSERAGGDSRRMGNKRKAAEITRSAAEDFALLTCRTTSEKHAAEFLSTVTNVIHLT